MSIRPLYAQECLSTPRSLCCNYRTQFCCLTFQLPLLCKRWACVLCSQFTQQNLPKTMQCLQNPLFMCLNNTSNIWWIAPKKPHGLQISFNVIPLLVWFLFVTLCKQQSASFRKTRCQGSNIPKVGKNKNKHRLQRHDPITDLIHPLPLQNMQHIAVERWLKAILLQDNLEARHALNMTLCFMQLCWNALLSIIVSARGGKKYLLLKLL